MSLFKIILDDLELQDEPINLDKIKFQLVRDDVIRGLVLKVTSTLTFTGDGYDLLLEKRRNNVCEAVDVIIQHRCSEDEAFIDIFRGTIILSEGDAVQFNPIRCSCEAEIQDANFGAKIENNKKIKAFVGTPISKNEIDITAAVVTKIQPFSVATGAPSGSKFDAYSVFECLRFLVAFMSDGELDFESDYFSTGEGKDWFVTTGKKLRNNSGNPVYTSFEDLFKELFSQANISFSIENGDTIRIEPENDLFADSTSETIEGITDVVEFVDSSRFYDRVVVGADNVDDTGLFPEEFRFVGWNEEEYHLLGECNTGESLGIVSEFLIDHNSIRESIGVGSTDNDDENFLIWANSTNGNAIATPLFGLGYFYNITFNNQNKVSRHFGSIPNSIALFLGDPLGDGNFRASMSADQAFTGLKISNPSFSSIVFFNNDTPPPSDVFDNDGNFQVGSFRYNVPVDGVYNFRGKFDLRHEMTSGLPGSDQTLKIDIAFQRLDSGGTHIGDLETFTFNSSVQSVLAEIKNYSFNLSTGAKPLSAGEKVRIAIAGSVIDGNLNPTTSFTIFQSSRFLTISTEAALGVMETFDVSETRSLLSEFTTFISRSQYLNIIDNTNQKLVISGANDYHRNGWIQELEFELNGSSSIKLISNGS